MHFNKLGNLARQTHLWSSARMRFQSPVLACGATRGYAPIYLSVLLLGHCVPPRNIVWQSHACTRQSVQTVGSPMVERAAKCNQSRDVPLRLHEPPKTHLFPWAPPLLPPLTSLTISYPAPPVLFSTSSPQLEIALDLSVCKKSKRQM